MKPLVVRTISSAVFLLLMIAGIFIQPLLPIIFGLITAVMIGEYYKMTLSSAFPRERALVIISSVAFFVLLYLVRRDLIHFEFIYLTLIPVLLSFISLLFSSTQNREVEDAANCKIENIFFPIIYITIPFSSSILLEYSASGNATPMLLFSVFVLVWASDIGAYALGMGFGQRPNSRKIAPKLSPKKSWWGFIGGFVASVLCAALIWFIYDSKISFVQWLIIGAIIGIFSICGDLFESLIKRRASVKDSGTIMPGHGGMLDRFDSQLLVMPMVTLYLNFIGIV